MGILRKYFGHVFNFNEDKDAINMANDIEAIAKIIRDAQARAEGTATNDDGETLYTPYMNKLADQAIEQATDIGLAALNVLQLRNDATRVIYFIDDTFAGASLDLYAEDAPLGTLAAMRVHDLQQRVKSFCDAAAEQPAGTAIAPELLAIMTANDGIWSREEMTKNFTRAQIRDAMSDLRKTLDGAVGRLNAAALAHLSSKDPASMAVIAPSAPAADDTPKTKPAGPGV